MFDYSSLTTKGVELKARALNGEKFVFTRMEYGSGIPSGFSTTSTVEQNRAVLSARTALVNKKADIGLYSILSKTNYIVVKGKVVPSSLAADFKAKELGVYGKIDGEAEYLVAYFVEPTESIDVKPAELVGQDHTVIANVAIGNAANITIEYNPEIYPTKEDFDAAVAQNTADHESIKDLIDEKIEGMDISSKLTDVYNAINEEVSTRNNADIALQENIDSLEASVDEKIGNIDISASLRKTLQFDHVVDSDESLLAWANCTDKSMKNVLVKSGTYSLSGKMINLVSAGTKFIFGEDGNQINISAYDRGIGATADYGAVVIGLNVSVENSTYSSGEIDGVFYRGMTCINCKGTGNSSGNIEGIFNQCNCIDCTSSATATGTKADYYSCKGLMAFSFDESTATLTIDTD